MKHQSRMQRFAGFLKVRLLPPDSILLSLLKAVAVKYQLLDKITSGFYIVEPVYDKQKMLHDLRFNICNMRFLIDCGLADDDITGKTWREVFDERNPELEIFAGIFKTGRSECFGGYHEQRGQYYSASAFMLAKNRIAVFQEDITKRVTTEKKAAETAKELENIIESTDDLIWAVDRDYRLVFCNSAIRRYFKEYFGYDVRPGIDMTRLFSNESTETWKMYFDRVRLSGKFQRDFQVADKKHVLALTFNPVYVNNVFSEITIFGKDITDRIKLERWILQINSGLEQRVEERTRELQRSYDELESFSYTVSHEIKAPLRAVQGYSQRIAAHEDIDANIQSVQKISAEMIAMADKLLVYSRSAKGEICLEPLDMLRMIGSVFEEVTAHVAGRVVLDYETGMPRVVADKVLLREVVYNILSNAVKFSAVRDPAVITVGCRAKDGEYVFCFRDNGVGFDKDLTGKLFNLFERLHDRSAFEGSGVGLATVKRIVQRHGGKVWIESEEDEGTAVYFTLPIRSQEVNGHV